MRSKTSKQRSCMHLHSTQRLAPQACLRFMLAKTLLSSLPEPACSTIQRSMEVVLLSAKRLQVIVCTCKGDTDLTQYLRAQHLARVGRRK